MKHASLLTKFRQLFNRRVRDRRGQTTMEYVIILAIVFMLAMQIRQKLTTHLGQSVDNIGNQIDSWTNELGSQN